MKATTRLRVATLAIGAREPPREFKLWDVGVNATDYGAHVWNQRSVREVMARYAQRGNPILLDVEHNGAMADGQPAVTAGYARLEIRAGAPWLVFDWSDFGREQIRTGQRRFLSPEYDVDKNTGEILALYRVSLVADPGTHRARMLARSPNNGGTMQNTETEAPGPGQIETLQRAADGLVTSCKRGVPPSVIAKVIEAVKKLSSSVTGETESDDKDDAPRGPIGATRRRAEAKRLGLTDREITKCNERGVDPEKYAKVKAQSLSFGGR